MKKKISLLIYVDWLETLELLKPTERGVIFSNLLRDTAGLELLPMTPRGEVLFCSMLRQVRWDRDKWCKTSEERVKAGRKGGLATAKLRREQQMAANQADQEQDQDQEQVQEHAQDPPSREGAGERSTLLDFYCQTIEDEPSERVRQALAQYERELGTEVCREAIAIGGENGAVSWNYVRSVLENRKRRGDTSTKRWSPPRGGKRFITESTPLSDFERQVIARTLAEAAEEGAL